MRLAITRSAPDSSDLRNQCPTDRIQIFTRQAKKALDVKINKTDANDAEGLAHLVRSGWYREVRVKSREAMLVKALIGARSQLLGMATDLSNQIRGLMKTFGLVVPKGKGACSTGMSAPSHRRGCGRGDRDAFAAGLAHGARPDRRARPSSHRGHTRERHLPAVDDHAWRWLRHRGLVCGGGREPGELRPFARRWRLGRSHAAALLVGRHRLRGPYLTAVRQLPAGSFVQGGDGPADARTRR